MSKKVTQFACAGLIRLVKLRLKSFSTGRKAKIIFIIVN